MRVLVTGDRNWDDMSIIHAVLTGYAELADVHDEMFYVIQGGARGADAIAEHWAKDWEDVESITVEADWEKHGLSAGPIRNRQMLAEHEPEVVLAFHDDLKSSKGTRNCVMQAKDLGIPTYVISRA